MTHFFSDHVLINGQAAAAGYSLSKKTQLITVFVDLPTGEKAKFRIPPEHDQYPEAYDAWHESLHHSKENTETPDLYTLMNEPIAPPTYDPSKVKVDMVPVPRPAPSSRKDPETPTIRGKGFRIVFNEEIERTQIIFTKFPNQATRDLVKAAGFYWSPNNQAWQKKLTKKAQRAAEEVAAQLAALKVA